MNELQIFNNPEFGELRTFIEPDGTKLFCGSDIAKALGYARPRNAINRYCKGALRRGTPTASGMQTMLFIPEGDVYRLMVKAADQSNNPDIKERAERFGGWIFDEVLPSVNHAGAYITNRADPATLRQKADELESVTALNDMAKLMLPVLQSAGMAPVQQALTLKQIYRRAGFELPLNDLRAQRELYDIRSIAKRTGILSLNQKPHELAVAAIIRKLKLSDQERELVSFEKNGHMGTTYQYTDSVAMMVSEWVQDHGFPKEIMGDRRTYKVQYETQLERRA